MNKIQEIWERTIGIEGVDTGYPKFEKELLPLLQVETIKAWVYNLNGTDEKIYFNSIKPHCVSCSDEKDLGYGQDVDGCCCVHVAEYYTNPKGEK